MKKKSRFIGGALLFIALALLITAIASHVTRPWNSKAEKIEKTLYSDDTDMEQTEVALIGGSHANNGFNPSVIWRENRIKAYNFSFSGEPLYLTHYYLEELFQRRKLKLVVLDLYYIGLKNEYFSRDSYVFELVDNMHWSKNKWDFIRNRVAPKNRDRYYFPLNIYHTRWEQLTLRDLLREPDPGNDFWLGSDYHFERFFDEPVSFEPWEDTGSIQLMPALSEEYLRKIIELVQANDCDLLFTALPHRYNDANAPDTWVENEYPVYNHARQIAAEYGIPVITFDDDLLREIGFVPEEDMYNKGHMNIYGSEKVARYLGAYMEEHYEFTRFPKGQRDLWDEYLEKYERVCQENFQEIE